MLSTSPAIPPAVHSPAVAISCPVSLRHLDAIPEALLTEADLAPTPLDEAHWDGLQAGLRHEGTLRANYLPKALRYAWLAGYSEGAAEAELEAMDEHYSAIYDEEFGGE